jgi:hypothetical protein
MRVRTNLKAAAEVQPDVEGKLTLRTIPGGRIGADDARRTLTTLTVNAE